MTDHDVAVSLLDRIVAAAEAGDPADIYEIYAPGAVIWHNHDLKESSVEQNARLLAAMDRWVADRRYTERRISTFPGGAVQQHVLRGTRRSTGEEVALHACVVIAVEDGRVTRLDEYIDSAEASHFAP
ncbi:nuclear transport factor 2 family protein [Janibacter melonis]|uniref:nuclear transport factor 2 family protein n=1 Tax=Janibacter melonis TaxID=262209 RepID=UPI001E5F6444|nr:nuclear transport factor 2 family protein [Janibacter melonis]MCB5991913.1 nuclear transport factor 2 family protein [Janibacter melonis]